MRILKSYMYTAAKQQDSLFLSTEPQSLNGREERSNRQCTAETLPESVSSSLSGRSCVENSHLSDSACVRKV